jgi:hypothetical protein
MISAGKHNGKLKDYGMGTTKTGKPLFFAIFDVNGEDITYRGMIESEKQKTMNLRAMADLGLSSPDDLVKIVDGPDGGALELGCEVSLTVEHREYNGKTMVDIKWINPLNQSKFKTVDASERAHHQVSLASLTGEAAALLASRGVKKKQDVPF